MGDVRSLALEFREIINILISTFSVVLAAMFAHHIAGRLRITRYWRLPWEDRLCMGLLFIFIGEFFRSSTIWHILHYDGAKGTYLTDVVPLIIALICIVIGSSCVIRVMSPEKCGHRLWLSSLALGIALIGINYFF